nr:gpi mannosyltransferase 2 [Quercus suber]
MADMDVMLVLMDATSLAIVPAVAVDDVMTDSRNVSTRYRRPREREDRVGGSWSTHVILRTASPSPSPLPTSQALFGSSANANQRILAANDTSLPPAVVMDVLSTYFSPSSRVGGPAVAKGKAAQQRLPASPQRLVPLFFVWKLILLVCVALSPGPGYDTSSRIFLDAGSSSAANRVHHSWLVNGIEHLVLRLTRWDAIYFTSAASHGKIYEQEWAFSFVLSRFTSWIATVLFWPFSVSSLVQSALAGILISNLSHLLAVLVLYRLIYEVVPASPIRKRLLAFTTAGLHVISPAGVFLCAPYGESTFALFNFLGMLSYVFAAQARFSDAQHAKVPRHARMQEASWTVTAGLCFAIASTIRGNGLLSGIMFAWDVIAPGRLAGKVAQVELRVLEQKPASDAVGGLVLVRPVRGTGRRRRPDGRHGRYAGADGRDLAGDRARRRRRRCHDGQPECVMFDERMGLQLLSIFKARRNRPRRRRRGGDLGDASHVQSIRQHLDRLRSDCHEAEHRKGQADGSGLC